MVVVEATAAVVVVVVVLLAMLVVVVVPRYPEFRVFVSVDIYSASSRRAPFASIFASLAVSDALVN